MRSAEGSHSFSPRFTGASYHWLHPAAHVAVEGADQGEREGVGAVERLRVEALGRVARGAVAGGGEAVLREPCEDDRLMPGEGRWEGVGSRGQDGGRGVEALVGDAGGDGLAQLGEAAVVLVG